MDFPFFLPITLAVGLVSTVGQQHLHVNSQQAPRLADTRTIIEHLRTGTLQQRRAALQSVLTIPIDKRSDELWERLYAELDVVNKEYRLAAAESRRPVYAGTDYYALLVRSVGQSDDPKAIQPLLGAIGTGGMAAQALVRFGELAAPGVLELAHSAGSSFEAAAALRVLQRMLEANGVLRYPLSNASRERAKEAVRQHLQAEVFRGEVPLRAAIDLAGTLKDGTLLAIVGMLAKDPAALVDRGITDPERLAVVQAQARRIASSKQVP